MRVRPKNKKHVDFGMLGFGDLNGIFTSKKVIAEPQKATVVFVQADRICLNLVLFLQQFFLRTKTTALGLCNCSYLEYLQVQVSNFQVSGRNLWWFKGFQISEPWRILVLPAYRAIGIGLTPITGPLSFSAGGHGSGSLGWGHSLAMTAWPWRHFKGLILFFFGM